MIILTLFVLCISKQGNKGGILFRAHNPVPQPPGKPQLLQALRQTHKESQIRMCF